MRRRLLTAVDQNGGPDPAHRCQGPETCISRARVADSRLAGQARDPCTCASRLPLLRVPISQERGTRLLPRDTCIACVGALTFRIRGP